MLKIIYLHFWTWEWGIIFRYVIAFIQNCKCTDEFHYFAPPVQTFPTRILYTTSTELIHSFSPCLKCEETIYTQILPCTATLQNTLLRGWLFKHCKLKLFKLSIYIILNHGFLSQNSFIVTISTLTLERLLSLYLVKFIITREKDIFLPNFIWYCIVPS